MYYVNKYIHYTRFNEVIELLIIIYRGHKKKNIASYQTIQTISDTLKANYAKLAHSHCIWYGTNCQRTYRLYRKRILRFKLELLFSLIDKLFFQANHLVYIYGIVQSHISKSRCPWTVKSEIMYDTHSRLEPFIHN